MAELRLGVLVVFVCTIAAHGWDVTQRQEKRVSQPAQQRALQQRNGQPRANALSGNDSRSANWQAQQQRGAQSRQLAARQQQPRQVSGGRAERREFRHR